MRGDLSTTAMLILSSCAQGPLHGYAIGKDIERRTDGAVRPGTTSLYRTIRELLDAGLLTDAPGPVPKASDDERRRYFRTTKAGREALAAEMSRLQRVLAATKAGLAAHRGRA
jgi:DNA-binding PadR family transcriptional regulator